jgi:hypothetical protein
MTIMIRFRYMTDEGTTYSGWFIKTATVGGQPMTLSKLGASTPARFQVTVVAGVQIGGNIWYFPWDMPTTSPANKGMSLAAAATPNFVVLVVTPTTIGGYYDYSFQVTKTPLVGFFP